MQEDFLLTVLMHCLQTVLKKFDKAYEEGYISGVFGTNLTYRSPELLQRPWFHEVDVSKIYFIFYCVN